jgi:hypothetical protein
MTDRRRIEQLDSLRQRSLRTTAMLLRCISFFYNFCRVHKTFGATPAMAAGLVDRVLKLADCIEMIDAANVPTPRGPYKEREAIEISN